MCMFWYMPHSVLLIIAYSCHSVNVLTSMNFYWDSFGSWHVDLRIYPLIIIKKWTDSVDHWVTHYMYIYIYMNIVLCFAFVSSIQTSLLHIIWNTCSTGWHCEADLGGIAETYEHSCGTFGWRDAFRVGQGSCCRWWQLGAKPMMLAN